MKYTQLSMESTFITDMYCEHVYKEMGSDICPKCGGDTHRIDWKKENLLHKKWLRDNPDAWKSVGWWSI